MPEQLIEKIKGKLPRTWKSCFAAAMIFGLIAHIYKLTSWLPNWDSLVFRYDSQNMVAMGRWFLPVASAPSSFYDLPWVAGLLAILFHALAAVCICKMFDVKKKMTALLIGAAVVSFPTVTSVMMYNYVADSYSLSFLFACLAALLMTNKNIKLSIPAAVLIALSVGIYQAYITVTVMLLLAYLIIEATKKAEIKCLLLQGVKFMVTGAVGMALYYLVLTVVLKITGTQLLDYQGFSDAAALSGLNIPASLYTIKEALIGYFFDFSNGVSLFTIINIAIFALAILFYVADIVRNKLNILNILALVVLVLLLPFCACLLGFVNSSIDYHNLMRMGFFVFYLLYILQYESTDTSCCRLNIIKAWAVLILTGVMVFNNIIVANISYHKLNMAYEKSYGVLIRLADRIEQTDDAEKCDSILVLGALEGSEAYTSYLPPDMTGTTDGFILRADDEIVGQSVLCSALNDYCGKNYKFLAGDEKNALLDKIDTDSLGNWPSADSVFVIDNVIVIKLGD